MKLPDYSALFHAAATSGEASYTIDPSGPFSTCTGQCARFIRWLVIRDRLARSARASPCLRPACSFTSLNETRTPGLAQVISINVKAVGFLEMRGRKRRTSSAVQGPSRFTAEVWLGKSGLGGRDWSAIASASIRSTCGYRLLGTAT